MTDSLRLVLGAGGFLGGALARELRRGGRAVRGFGRRPATVGRELHDLPWVEAELEDEDALARALDGVDVVHHLLGSAKPAAADAGALGREVAGTRRLLQLMEAKGVRRLTYASSGGTVYGASRVLPTPETEPLAPTTAYARSKVQIEELLARGEALHGVASVVLRLSNPFGPGLRPLRGQGLIPAVLARLMRDEPVEVWGDGAMKRDFLWVGDAVEAFLAAERRAIADVINIGSGVSRSVLEVVADAGRVVGREPVVIHREARAADLPTSILDVSRAADVLGWRCRADWMRSLQETADWVRRTGSPDD